MYNERLNKVVSQVCHAWEEQAAEHEGKMRALANSIVAEHEAERFNTQKAFKSALAAKNNEINALLSECKKLKALLTHIHSENKDLQKKLAVANRTIESLKQGVDENGMPLPKSTFSDDGTYISTEDSVSGGGELYGSLEDFSHGGQLPNWNQQNRQQSHLFPRERNSAEEMYNFNAGGLFPEGEGRGPPPPTGGGGIGGLFSSSNQSFPSRAGPSQGLVYGGRYVLEGAGEDGYAREDFHLDRGNSYDLTRPDRDRDREGEEFLQNQSFPDGREGPFDAPQHPPAPKRLSPSASPFMPNFAGRGLAPSLGLGTSPTLRSGPPSLSSVDLNPPPPPGFENYADREASSLSEAEHFVGAPLPSHSVESHNNIPEDDASSLSSSIPSSSVIDVSSSEAANLLTQMRLQSKSSKLDAKPLGSAATNLGMGLGIVSSSDSASGTVETGLGSVAGGTGTVFGVPTENQNL